GSDDVRRRETLTQYTRQHLHREESEGEQKSSPEKMSLRDVCGLCFHVSSFASKRKKRPALQKNCKILRSQCERGRSVSFWPEGGDDFFETWSAAQRIPK